MKDDIALKLFEFNYIIKANDNIYRGIAKRFGISECSFWILYSLRIMNVSNQSDICELMHEPKQTVNSALKNLEAEGIIEMTSAPDRRSKKITLTERGILLAKKTVDLIINAEMQSISEIPPDELDMFLSVFRKYTDILSEKIGSIK